MNKVESKMVRESIKRCGLPLNGDEAFNFEYVGVHHKNEWDHGYDIYEYVRGWERRRFYTDMNDMEAFLKAYIQKTRLTEVIIAPCYKYRQFDSNPDANGHDIYTEIKQFLKDNGINRQSGAGVRFNPLSHEDLLCMTLEGAFRGVSKLCLFFPERNLIIEPTHHFDLAYCTNDTETEKYTIQSLLCKHPNVEYYQTF